MLAYIKQNLPFVYVFILELGPIITWDRNAALAQDIQLEYDRYLAVGEALKDDNLVSYYDSVLLDMANTFRTSDLFPYVVIVAPSGSGKTQFPFALRAKGRNVHHMVISNEITNDRMQRIYKFLAGPSIPFKSALKWDWDTLMRSHAPFDVLSCISLQQSSLHLYTVQFLFDLLSNGRIVGTTCTISDLKRYVRTLCDASQQPIICLDEAIDTSEKEKSYLRLACNILRSVGIVTIMMGTNSSACNLIGDSVISRGRSRENHLWCKLITRLPKLSETTIPFTSLQEALGRIEGVGHDQFVTFVKQHMYTCLPYFMIVLAKVVNNNEFQIDANIVTFMDTLLAKMTSFIRESKPMLESVHGLYCQLALQHCLYHPRLFSYPLSLIDDCGNDNIFVAHHFEPMMIDGIVDLYLLGQSTQAPTD